MIRSILEISALFLAATCLLLFIAVTVHGGIGAAIPVYLLLGTASSLCAAYCFHE